MNELTFPTRLSIVVSDLLDALIPHTKAFSQSHQEDKRRKGKREGPERREFFYYTRVLDYETRQVIGHLADIGSGGFKLDCQKPVPINTDFRLLIHLTHEVADKPHLIFSSSSRWCRADPDDPYVYNVGFQMTDITPEDLEIFNRMMEKYGREYGPRTTNLRRSNRW